MLIQNGNQLHNRRMLLTTQMKPPGLHPIDAQLASATELNGLQRLNVQANATPSTQLIHQLLGATNNFQASHGSNVHQTESRLALAKQNSQEQDIQSLQELRHFLE